MTISFEDGWGGQAIDLNQLSQLFVNSVKSGYTVTINSGTLGQSDTLQVASGSAVVDGSSVSLGSNTNVQVDNADSSNPRKDVVYIDSSGNPQVAKGTAEAAKPSGETARDTYRPAPPNLTSTSSTAIQEVWVPAGASSISASELSDRKISSDLTLNSVDTDSITNAGDITDSGNSNIIYDQSAQTLGSGNESGDFSSVTTDEASITNQTDVRAHLASDQSYSTSNGWVRVDLDDSEGSEENVGKDTLGEWDNTDHHLTPNESGEYWVAISVTFSVASDGDRLGVRLRNTSDNETVLDNQFEAAGPDTGSVSNGKKLNLKSGDNYEMQAINLDNDDTIRAIDASTFITVERANV